MTPDELLLRLDDLGFGPGARLPSDRRLAELLGMRHSTVNRLLLELSGRGKVIPDGRKRFRSEHSAAMTGEHPLIHVIVPGTVKPYFEEASERLPLFRIHYPELGDPLQLRRQLSAFRESPPAGLIIWPAGCRRELLALRAKGVPIVCYGGGAGTEFHHVGMAVREIVKACIDHLIGKGHQELACLGAKGVRQEFVDQFGLEVTRRNRVYSAKRTAYAETDSEICETLSAWMQGASLPTAVLLVQRSLVHPTLLACRKLGLRVPGDLSLMVSAYHGADLAGGFTSLERATATEATQGLAMLASLIRERPGRTSPPYSVLIKPAIHEGFTVRDRRARTPSDNQPAEHSGPLWPINQLDRRQELGRRNSDRYQLAIESADQQQQISLAPAANRSLLGRNSWIPGAPLSHLPSGLATIHGIRFAMPEGRPKKRSFILVAGGACRQALPQEVTLPLSLRAKALYFLHICGYAARGGGVGSYVVENSAGRKYAVPLLAHDEEDHFPGSNIQDWWPGYPQRSRDDSKYYIIAANEDPLEYERYCYTLEWRNPTPGRKLRNLTIRIPEQSKSLLGLLAVTAVVP